MENSYLIDTFIVNYKTRSKNFHFVFNGTSITFIKFSRFFNFHIKRQKAILKVYDRLE